MKNRNPQLAYLIVQKYAHTLFRLVRRRVITAEFMSKELSRFMHKIGLPRQIVVLAICAYVALL